jgi:hypothetical protein
MDGVPRGRAGHARRWRCCLRGAPEPPVLHTAWGQERALPPPSSASWPQPPRLEADVAYFSPGAPGAEVELEFPAVQWRQTMACAVRFEVPTDLPAELESSAQPGEGLTARAFCWQRGLVVELEGPDAAGFIHPVLEAADGRPIVLRGASGGGGRTVAVTEALPAGTRTVCLRGLEVQRQVRGPWTLPFRIPGA